MSDRADVRRAFVALHLVLGLALLWGGVHTAVHHGAFDRHARIIGAVEAVGAAAFLIPRALRFGAALLLFTMLGGVLLHAVRGEFQPDLLVYAAGVLFVAVHGSAYGAVAARA
jgi:uncharacterized membrane protein YphA (DoxX/SURF4 family)